MSVGVPRWAPAALSKLRSLASGLFQCPVCRAWSSNRWTDVWGDRLCRRCGSRARHRLLALLLLRFPRLALASNAGPRRVLHLAPEASLHRMLQPFATSYVSADALEWNVDVRLDLTDPPFRAKSFDLVVVIDVLEHIPDDVQALLEVERLLAADGVALISVPIPDGRPTTYEDFSIVTPEGRETHFGQADHVRVYGDDFRGRLHSAGLDFHEFSSRSLPLFARLRFGLRSLGNHPLTCKERVIFVATPRHIGADRSAVNPAGGYVAGAAW
jgi:SAM-dependent methyltransferase